MTAPKPSEVAMRLASNIIGHAEQAPDYRPANPTYWAGEIDKAIAAAVMAEREACANRARKHMVDLANPPRGFGLPTGLDMEDGFDMKDYLLCIGDDIYDEIRARTQEL